MLTDLRKAAALGPRRWIDLLRAVGYLAIARWELAQRDTRSLIEQVGLAEPAATPARAAEMAERVEFAIVRMGPRVPWRGDCLVQALAARRWLATAGIASQVHLGARTDGEFAAHAWLTVGDQIVTGAPIEDYVALLDPRKSALLSMNQR